MIISPTRGFVFFKPMKTAGSSVEFALALSCGPDDLVTGGDPGPETEAGFLQQNNVFKENNKKMLKFHFHTTPDILRSRMKKEDFDSVEKLKWITMTRNPWDCLVSYYWWCMCEYPVINKWATIDETMSKKESQKLFENFIFRMNGKARGLLASTLDECKPWEYIQNFNTQFLDERMDHYIRYENIEQDFEHVVDSLGLYNVELPRFKTTQKKLKKHYSYYYTNETKQIVADGFKDYIEKFDYKFEWKDKKLSRRERANKRRNKK